MIRLSRPLTGDRAPSRRRRRRGTEPPDPSPAVGPMADARGSPEPARPDAAPETRSHVHGSPASGPGLKLSIGVAHKRGLPGFGSMGASCGVELELEADLLGEAPELFHARVRAAYDACARAVQDELDRRGGARPPERGSPPAEDRLEPHMPPATPAQVRALLALTRRLDLDLDDLVLKRLHVARPEALSRSQASRLIGELQAHVRDEPR